MDQLALRLAQYINRNTPNSSSVPVLKYSIEILLNTIVVFGIVLVISVFTGDFLRALLPLICSPLLRYFSGGYHFRSPHMCNVVSSIFMLLGIYLPITYWDIGFALTILSAAIVIVKAPNGIKGVSRIKEGHYPILKVISFLIVCTNFVFGSTVIAVVFFLQALTLTKMFQRAADWIKI